jgi:hypothetical protein
VERSEVATAAHGFVVAHVIAVCIIGTYIFFNPLQRTDIYASSSEPAGSEEQNKTGARGCGKEALERNSGTAKLMLERGQGTTLTMKAGR